MKCYLSFISEITDDVIKSVLDYLSIFNKIDGKCVMVMSSIPSNFRSSCNSLFISRSLIVRISFQSFKLFIEEQLEELRGILAIKKSEMNYELQNTKKKTLISVRCF